MWQSYYQPETLLDALELLREHAERARLVAGGTDVLVELQRGIRPTTTTIDIARLRGLRYIREEGGSIHVGALATHNDAISSALCRRRATPLVQACIEIGAPQIRSRATIAGNLVTGSPANDAITPLVALDAHVVLASARGERILPLRDFYLGVRRTALRPDEVLREVRFPALSAIQRGIFIKLGLRRAQAISVINLSAVIALGEDGVVIEARIALGCLAPTVVRAMQTEQFLRGRTLSPEVCAEAGRIVRAEVRPIDDLRGSGAYRLDTLESLLVHALARLADGTHADMLPAAPVLLDSAARPDASDGRGSGGAAPQLNKHESYFPSGNRTHADRDLTTRRTQAYPLAVIDTTINGRPYRLEHSMGRTLLQAIREDAGLTGTKEGCGEGECGACTVWIDGQAAMSCLIPAGQARGASVTTIEGLGGDDGAHPLQQAFVRCAAVQCGFCIPGMLMAGAKLLEECPQPDIEQARAAISGNLCRCTGYRKILDAIFAAAEPVSDKRLEAMQ